MLQLLALAKENSNLKREVAQFRELLDECLPFLAAIRAARADPGTPFEMSMGAPELETVTDTKELLTELRTSQTDLARFVEAVIRNRMPYIVVSPQALRAWQRREPQTWEKVADWMAANDVAVVIGRDEEEHRQCSGGGDRKPAGADRGGHDEPPHSDSRRGEGARASA